MIDVSTSQPAKLKNVNPSAASEALKDVLLPIAKAFSSKALNDSLVLSVIPAVACNLLIAVPKFVPATVAAAPAPTIGTVTPVVSPCPIFLVVFPSSFKSFPIVSKGKFLSSCDKLFTSACVLFNSVWYSSKALLLSSISLSNVIYLSFNWSNSDFKFCASFEFSPYSLLALFNFSSIEVISFAKFLCSSLFLFRISLVCLIASSYTVIFWTPESILKVNSFILFPNFSK